MLLSKMPAPYRSTCAKQCQPYGIRAPIYHEMGATLFARSPFLFSGLRITTINIILDTSPQPIYTAIAPYCYI